MTSGPDRLISTLIRSIRVELRRVSRKPFFYLIPLLAAFIAVSTEFQVYQRAMALHQGTIDLPPGVTNPFQGVPLSQLLSSFRWDHIVTAALAAFLLNWGISLVGYLGTAWFADDLTTNVIRQVGVLRRRVVTPLLGRYLALAVYVAALMAFVVGVSLLATAFLDNVPYGRGVSLLSPIPVRNFTLFVMMAVMWASLVATTTMLSKNPLLGAAVGVLWPIAEAIILIVGMHPWQLWLAKLAPISTIRSLVAFLYDRFSWTAGAPPTILWVTSPPLTRSLEDGVIRPYLLPFSFLFTVLVIYMLIGLVGLVAGYRIRTKQ